MALYASPSDIIARKSSTTLGQLCSDSGTAVTPSGLQSDGNLDMALQDASGAIDAALMQSGRYTAEDLEGLASLSDNSASYLSRICCDIAMAYLFARKPTFSVEQYKQYQDLADQHLERLRKGEHVLFIQRNIDAGTPKYSQTSVEAIEQQGYIRDRTLNYYPKRYSTGG
jgi:phage gp36-like protein